MAIFDFIIEIGKTIISPITTLIDDLNTSDEEKLTLKNQMKQLELTYQAKLLELDSQLLESKTNIIIAEAKGESWLQRNWRPMLMVTFMVIIANNYIIAPYLNALGVTAVMLDIPGGMWAMLTVGVGGYVGGRSWEKVKRNA